MEHYLALFEPDLKAGGYVVTFPDFGYGVTQGETDEEALAMAQRKIVSDHHKSSFFGLRRRRATSFAPKAQSSVRSSAQPGNSVM